MSKTIICLTILFFITIQTIFAQNDSALVQKKSTVYNKKGVKIGPEKGDRTIGLDATPFFEYAGNMLKISDEFNPAPTFGFTAQKPGMIYYKYMKSDLSALRFSFRLGITRNTDKDGSGFSNTAVDKYITSAANLGFDFGIENSPFMKSRLRGFYGWQASVGVAPYEGPSYSNPLISVIGKYKYVDGSSEFSNFVEKGGNTLSIGAGGFIGLEYFIAPKLSLSGQFNLMLIYAYQLKRNYVPDSGTSVVIDSGQSSILLDNLASGSIILMGYF